MQRRKMHISDAEYEDKLAQMLQTYVGQELPSDVPMAPPLGYKRLPTMVDHVREMVRSERLRLEAEAAGAESFEEADDFDIDDEPDISSGYEFEEVFEPQPARFTREELRDALQELLSSSGGEREAAASSGGAAEDQAPDRPEGVKGAGSGAASGRRSSRPLTPEDGLA